MNKSIFKSLTAWGGLIAVVPTLLRLVGIEVSETEVSTLATLATAIYDGGAQAVGLIMVIWGRFRAGGVTVV